jgi:cell division protein FtsQ
MKRPDGFFDAGPSPRSAQSPAATSTGAQRAKARSKPKAAAGSPRQTAESPQEAEQRPRSAPPGARPSSPRAERRRARVELRRASRARRRAEREEVRRFTRRSRNRRIGFAVVGGLILSLVALVLIAVFSPLLALREVKVTGAVAVDAALLQSELEAQLGTPLALIDAGRIDDTMQGFPLIRSYSTETVPPGTILVHIVERTPIVVVATDAGFALVDPAGIVLGESAERPAGVPLVVDRGAAIPNPAFDAAVEVLLAMSAELRAQVDTITSTTRDDVTMTLVGAQQTVRWGSADDSERKAALLASLRAIHGAMPGTFDVSAPGNGIFRVA